jgi:hypothetical protein
VSSLDRAVVSSLHRAVVSTIGRAVMGTIHRAVMSTLTAPAGTETAGTETAGTETREAPQLSFNWNCTAIKSGTLRIYILESACTAGST